MKRFFFFALISLFLASCAVFEQEIEPPASDIVGGGIFTEGEYATLRFSLANDSARAVLPQYDVRAFFYQLTYYRIGDDETGITYQKDGKSIFDYETLTATDTTLTLLTGNYCFSVDAFNSAEATTRVLSYTDEVAVTADTTTLSFALTAAEGTGAATTGSVSVTVTFPANEHLSGVSAKLVAFSPAAGTVTDTQDLTSAVTTTDGTASVTYTKSGITAGTYLLYITLTTQVNGETFTTVIPELVTVAPGVQSSNEQSPIALTDATANTRYAISYQNANGTDVTDWASAATVPLSFVAGQTITLPAASDVKRDDYTFLGWYESADFSGEAVTQFTGGTEEKTFYAKWWGTLKPGSEINAILKNLGANSTATAFAQSTTAPANGTEAQYLDNAENVPVWLGGTTIYYYAAGYTDATPQKKILLNANSASMFSGCNTLETIDVTGFDTRNATSLNYMFYNCQELTALDVSGWDTSNVTNMHGVCAYCFKLETLGADNVKHWNTANVTDMGEAFRSCRVLTALDVSGWDTKKVRSMGMTFYECQALTVLDVSGFDTSKVTTMRSMFFSCSSLTTLDVNGFNTAKVTDMKYMFNGCSKLTSLDVTGFDTANVTDMSYMFNGCSKLTSLNVTGFDTSKVTDMQRMFQSCTSLTTLDVSSFNTANVTDMRYMFSSCSSLTTIYASDSFKTTAVTTSLSMFQSCSKLVGGAGTAYNGNKVEATYAHIDVGTDDPGYFTDKNANTFSSASYDNTEQLIAAIKNATGDIAVSVSATVNPGDVKKIIEEVNKTSAITSLKLDLTDATAIVNGGAINGDLKNGLMNNTKLVSIELPSSLTRIEAGTFQSCTNLTTVTIPANVKQLGNGVFTGCEKLASVTFKDENGVWNVGSHIGVTVKDPATNATNLTTTYKDDAWQWQSSSS